MRSVFVLGLVGTLAASPAASLGRNAGRGTQSTAIWAGMVVSRITRTDMQGAARSRRGGTVTMRVRIAADGRLEGAAVEEGSGSLEFDERALKAVKAAAPFPPPPQNIVTLEGFTEISFPLQLETATKPAP